MKQYIGLTDRDWQKVLDLLPHRAETRMLIVAKLQNQGKLPSGWISRSYLGELGYDIALLTDSRMQVLSDILVGDTIVQAEREELIQMQMEEWNVPRTE